MIERRKTFSDGSRVAVRFCPATCDIALTEMHLASEVFPPDWIAELNAWMGEFLRDVATELGESVVFQLPDADDIRNTHPFIAAPRLRAI